MDRPAKSTQPGRTGRCLKGSAYILVAFACSLAAIGVPYWQIPYSHLNLPDALIGFGLLVVFAFAVGAPFVSLYLAPFAALLGMAAPLIVLARINHDAAIDPTSHNLWPLEVGIAFLTGIAVSVAGAIVGFMAAAFISGRMKTGQAREQ